MDQSSQTAQYRQFPQQWAEEVHGKHNLDFIDDYHAPDWVGHIDGEDLTNSEYKQMQRQLVEGIPAAEFTFEPVVVEGNMVAGHWVMAGDHTGEFLGVKPTGRTLRVTGTYVVRYGEDGTAKETWGTVDRFGMLQQLGIAPTEFTGRELLRTAVNIVRAGV
ncbi:ester cyclase [Halomicroarcula sp. GCM10025709]|uniref:ester cyclase n=1 Tax=Haloarcula TaxID=2237 RepID=UPI0024C39C43|nr:ester cyclase [Halomicroarcula sp. YJ-61-S]